MCRDMGIDVYIDMCTGMSFDMCIDMCMGMSANMCIYMRIDMCTHNRDISAEQEMCARRNSRNGAKNGSKKACAITV